MEAERLGHSQLPHVVLILSGNMENTLTKNSGILRLKSKFFLYRAVIYSSFLLIPVWIQKTLLLNQALLSLMMVLYIMFMIGQWFLLGKEIDYRLKIYFSVNSSIDRLVYRLLLGMIAIIIYFNILSLLPGKWIYNCFWITWVILGLFYSWPTRGKIIKESVTTNFGEYRYLDSFEKTLLMLIILLFVFSIPELPTLTHNEALKLFFDPLEKHSLQFWNFLQVNYYPFKKYPTLYKLAWCIHFYLVGMGSFLVIFYAVLRYFVSRRLSLLGVFALLSSWSFSKILGYNYGASITTTYSLLWIWTILWVTKSSSYRAGLFLGFIGYWGSIINQSFAFLLVIQLLLFYFLLLRHKTKWFRRKLIKYALPGVALTLFTLLISSNAFDNLQPLNLYYFNNVMTIVNRKAFFSLSIFGIVILFLKYFAPHWEIMKNLQFEMRRVGHLACAVAVLLLYSMVFDSYLVKSFFLMWTISLLSLIPLELLFQSISRLRSRRNMIYLVYIIICLLDSHFEGRVKIFLKLFNS